MILPLNMRRMILSKFIETIEWVGMGVLCGALILAALFYN